MPRRSADFESLRTCFVTGQMSEAQLHAHFRECPMFRRWWDRRADRVGVTLTV